MTCLAMIQGMKVTKMNDGVKKYRVDWRDDKGKRRRTRFKTRREADEFMAKTAIAVESGDWVDPATTRKKRVSEVYESWFNRIKTKGARGKGPAAPKTLSGYQSIYRTHIKPHWESVSLDQVSYQKTEDWIFSLDVGNRTKNEVASIFIRIMDEAVRLGYVAKNPARDRSGKADYLPRVKREKEHIYLDAGQVRSLVDAMPDDMTRLLIFLGALSGLRWGEATALRWSDLDLRSSTAWIKRAYSDVEGVLHLGDTKNHLERRVPLHRPTLAAIKVLASAQGVNLEKIANNHALIIQSPTGLTMRRDNWTTRVLRPVLESLKKEGSDVPQKVRFHDLRHTAVSLAVSSRANIKVVQAIAGHSSAQMTLDVYAGLFFDDLTAAAELVDDHISDAFAPKRPQLTVVA